MGYSGAGGKLIHEKIQKQKISRHCVPLRVHFLHRRSPSWTTLVLYLRAVSIFNEPDLNLMATLSSSSWLAIFRPFFYLKTSVKNGSVICFYNFSYQRRRFRFMYINYYVCAICCVFNLHFLETIQLAITLRSLQPPPLPPHPLLLVSAYSFYVKKMLRANFTSADFVQLKIITV